MKALQGRVYRARHALATPWQKPLRRLDRIRFLPACLSRDVATWDGSVYLSGLEDGGVYLGGGGRQRFLESSSCVHLATTGTGWVLGIRVLMKA